MTTTLPTADAAQTEAAPFGHHENRIKQTSEDKSAHEDRVSPEEVEQIFQVFVPFAIKRPITGEAFHRLKKAFNDLESERALLRGELRIARSAYQDELKTENALCDRIETLTSALADAQSENGRMRAALEKLSVAVKHGLEYFDRHPNAAYQDSMTANELRSALSIFSVLDDKNVQAFSNPEKQHTSWTWKDDSLKTVMPESE